MAVDTIVRRFPERDGAERLVELRREMRPYVERFSLDEEVDREHQRIMVKRRGFSGMLQLDGEMVRVTLDYSFLVPGPIRRRITEGVTRAMERLAAKDAAE